MLSSRTSPRLWRGTKSSRSPTSSRPSRRASSRRLSGGPQARRAIARALVSDPTGSLADAPTGTLDARATRGVFQLLRDINASGTAVVMATHDLDLGRQAPCRVSELHEGAL